MTTMYLLLSGFIFSVVVLFILWRFNAILPIPFSQCLILIICLYVIAELLMCGEHWWFSKSSLNKLNETVTKTIEHSQNNESDKAKVLLTAVTDGTKLIYHKKYAEALEKYGIWIIAMAIYVIYKRFI